MQKISSTRHSYFETNVEQEPQSGNDQKVNSLVQKPCKFWRGDGPAVNHKWCGLTKLIYSGWKNIREDKDAASALKTASQ